MQRVQIFENFIGGVHTKSSSNKLFSDINPARRKDVIGQFQASTREEVIRALNSAKEAQSKWTEMPAPQRGNILTKAAEILESEKEDLARLLTREEGKTLDESRGEVSRAIGIFRFYGVTGYRLRGETIPSAEHRTKLFTVRQPLGVVSIITPWNFPIAIPAWKIAPALVCGNVVVFKPASYTPLIGLRIVEVLDKAGLPPGVLNFVTGNGAIVGQEMITNELVDAISFTGSLEVGEEIRRVTANASKNVRVQLELGGKNPTIVLEDADMAKAVDIVSRSAFGLTGEACTATSRAIVVDKIAEKFTSKIIGKAKEIRVGNGLVDGVRMGPVIAEKELNKILSYTKRGPREGARLGFGGRRLHGGEYTDGFFVQPTIFIDATQDMDIACDEIFGPVLSIISVKNFDEAVEVANKVEYGLTASIVTRNLSRAFEFIDRSDTGVVKVNKPTTGIEFQAPYGGMKKSSSETIKEQGEAVLDFYTRAKTVYLGY